MLYYLRNRRSWWIQIYLEFWHILDANLKTSGSGGIRTHAPEETGALNQRLRPLGHTTLKTVTQSRNFLPIPIWKIRSWQNY